MSRIRHGGSLLEGFAYTRAVAVLVWLVVLVGSAGVTFGQDLQALKGVALVIGNSRYEHLDGLINPANDARAIEDLLYDLGFDTEAERDLGADGLRQALDAFVEAAEDADVAVLYYAGHGIEAGDEKTAIGKASDEVFRK